MVTAHRESERKYDVQESTPLPDFAALPGVKKVAAPVEQRLDATYFDNAGLRLAANGVTFRRRTGGEDAGWHLKLPAVDGSRTELRLPLGKPNNAAPDELVRTVRSLVRDDELNPVARIRTTRTVYLLVGADDTPLAEVADDHVTAQLLGPTGELSSWREIEVELVNGADELLPAAGRLLERGGARPASGPSKLARVLGDRVPRRRAEKLTPKSPARDVMLAALDADRTRLLGADRGIRLGTPDSVHQARVAARRLRSVLGAFRPLFDRRVTDPLRDELKWFGEVLGGSRDAEVMRERLDELVRSQPGELVLGPVAARIASTMAARAGQADRQVAAALDSDRYFRLLDALDAAIADPPWSRRAAEPAQDVLPGRVRRTWKRARKLAKQADRAQDRSTALHELRKSAKRARYAGEAVEPAFGKPAKRYAKRMKKLQTVLGDHHDAIVTQDLLRTMGIQAHLAGENGFTYGVLHGAERTRAEQAEAGYPEVYRRAAKKSVRRWLG
jgi:CHAD domain-containing protein